MIQFDIMMFTTYTAKLACIAALAIGAVSASPVAAKPEARDLAARSSHVSFNNWGGFSSLNNFDNFYGVEDFSHARFDQVVVKENQLVCRTQAIEIIQQRLVVLQEMAKRIITETICEVEVQTVVFSQFHASLGSFHNDLRRLSGHRVGFDENVVGNFGEVFAADGSLTTHDFGFTGLDVGRNTVVVGGSNWNDNTSPTSVDSAFFSAQGARLGL
ncbi:hypothetical protein Moror_14341 [Moniliophthora roreri MCA 2997]|uniref:Uncharacterized protein n=1 Tax=Moniliophthora roreri (strain MCA 2997) TaxID=1381753 RepID=V2XLL8_MONRO|nr:hypothetical protein Moror_14341 [Moniliophthora roreri MCA 2997]